MRGRFVFCASLTHLNILLSRTQPKKYVPAWNDSSIHSSWDIFNLIWISIYIWNSNIKTRFLVFNFHLLYSSLWIFHLTCLPTGVSPWIWNSAKLWVSRSWLSHSLPRSIFACFFYFIWPIYLLESHHESGPQPNYVSAEADSAILCLGVFLPVLLF